MSGRVLRRMLVRITRCLTGLWVFLLAVRFSVLVLLFRLVLDLLVLLMRLMNLVLVRINVITSDLLRFRPDRVIQVIFLLLLNMMRILPALLIGRLILAWGWVSTVARLLLVVFTRILLLF